MLYQLMGSHSHQNPFKYCVYPFSTNQMLAMHSMLLLIAQLFILPILEVRRCDDVLHIYIYIFI